MIARKKKLPRYPWDEWFKKKRFELRKPRDYECRTYTMAQQVRTAAYARYLRVSIMIQDTTLTVHVSER